MHLNLFYWGGQPRAYYTEWSKSQREIYILYTDTYIWNLKRWHWWIYFQGSNGETDIENRPMDMVGGEEGEGDMYGESNIEIYNSVQLFSHVWLFATSCTVALQASLSITNSWSLLKLMSFESVCHPTIWSSVVPFSSCPQSFPASGSFQTSQLFISGGQSIGVSTLTSVLPMIIQDWFPLGWTGLIFLQSKGLSRVFSNTTVQKHQFFGTQVSL